MRESFQWVYLEETRHLEDQGEEEKNCNVLFYIVDGMMREE